MSEKQTPGWTWIFIAGCAAIPLVSLGGIIPAAIGAIGATACYAIARDGSGDTKQRMSICAAITILCWALFGGLAWAVFNMTTNQTISDKPVKAHIEQKTELTTAEKQSIYAKAAARKATVKERRKRLDEAFLNGRSTKVLEKQVKHAEKMYENHLEFSQKFNRLSAQELDDILAQGKAEGWPTN